MSSSRKTGRGRKLDPAILLNDGPWDDFDALCREEYAQLKSASPERLAEIAPHAAAMAGLAAIALIWLLNMTFGSALLFLLLASSAGLLALWQFVLPTYQPTSQDKLRAGGFVLVFSVGVLILNPILAWFIDLFFGASGFGYFVVLLLLAVGAGYMLREKLRAHSGDKAMLLVRFAQAFGFQYRALPNSFPTSKGEALGLLYETYDIRHHISGEWRGVRFDAGRYKESGDATVYLLVRASEMKTGSLAAETTTHKQFPDESKEMAAPVESFSRFRMRVQTGDDKGREAQFLRDVSAATSALLPGDEIYIGLEQGVLCIFAKRPGDFLLTDELLLQRDPDRFFQAIENDLALVVRLVDALAEQRKAFLYSEADQRSADR